MDQVCTTLATMAEENHLWHTAPCEFQKPLKLKLLIEKLLSEKLVKYANGAILLTSDCLARAIKEHEKEATRKCETFLESSLCGSASAGHSLLTVYERDAGISYEDNETQRVLKQGATMKERMVTRICDWAICKWQVHSDELATDMHEAGQMLR